MASHHHQLHPCHHHPPPSPAAAAAICTSTTCYCASPPSPTPSSDSILLQSLISCLQNPNPNPPPCHCDPLSVRRKDRSFGLKQAPHVRDSAAEALLASLVIRIDAVEAALRRREACVYGSSSVREAAARVIQIHFRGFLVRRSRSLRYLKDLAFIKARFNVLKSSIVDRARVDPVAASRRTVELLYKVDSIQDRDPMIVNGKRSLTRDLVGFLDYIDTIALERSGALTRRVKKVSVVQAQSGGKRVQDLRSEWRGLGRDRRVVIETMRGEVEDDEGEDSEAASSGEEETSSFPFPSISPHGVKKKSFGFCNAGLGDKQGARVRGKKNVNFADDGRNRNVISIREPVSNKNGGSGGGGQREMLESLRKRVVEMEAGLAGKVAPDDGDEVEESESGTSDGEFRGTTSSDPKTEQKTRHQHPGDDEEFTFPTPDHAKIDSRADRSLKIKS
uniref:BAG family molecular chaperone regulator 8, chloroplastic n=1 Tax=Kalanchoe fedtschenkoi TaxID=63787 RepID=A0A7N0RF50_KALFE